MKNIVNFFSLKSNEKKKITKKETSLNLKFNIKIIKAKLVLFVFIYVTSVIVSITLQEKAITKMYISMACNIKKSSTSNFELKDILKANLLLNEKCYKVEKVIARKANTELIEPFDTSVVDNIEETIPTNVDYNNITVKDAETYQRVLIGDINITNYASRKDIDYVGLLNRNINYIKASDKVLIYTTHTSESFKNSDRYKFKYSGTYRTRDANYNMLSVASVLRDRLNEKNITSVLNATPHDYTSYTNAYTNSRKTVTSELEKGRYGIIIDVHRDAYGDLNSSPTVQINGKKVAQVMIVLGIGTSGYANKYWDKNLALALQIMNVGNKMYKGLFRPLLIRNSKYNQDLNSGAILLEIGATGNTLEESYLAARCFANILAKMYK